MSERNELQAAIQRLIAGAASPDDLQLLQGALLRREISITGRDQITLGSLSGSTGVAIGDRASVTNILSVPPELLRQVLGQQIPVSQQIELRAWQERHLILAAQQYALEQQDLRQRLASAPPALEPYKGLNFFEEEDQSIFYGRQEIAAALVERILRPKSRLLVLHAPSGTGKTSLIRAGLIPRLLERGCYTLWAAAQPYPQAILRPLLRPGAPDYGDTPLRDFLGWMTQELRLAPAAPLVVFLDQFERLFDPQNGANLERVKRELADCVQASERALPLRLVIAIRSDFVGMLDSFSDSLPSVLDQRAMLPPLTQAQARQAILRPLEGQAVRWEEQAADAALAYLAQGVIEPPHLQLICSRLYEQALEKGQPAITCADVQAHSLEALHRDYLNDEMRRLPHFKLEAEMGWAVLKQLVSVQAIARPRTLAQVCAEVGQANPAWGGAVEALVNHLAGRRVLRTTAGDGEVRGESLVEIAHETLAQEILKHESQEEIRGKAVRELVERGLDDWRMHGALLDPGRLHILEEYRDVLGGALHLDHAPDEAGLAAQELLLRSALEHGHEVASWRERLPAVVGKVESGLLEELAAQDERRARAAAAGLAALAAPSTAQRLAGWVEADFTEAAVTWYDPMGKAQALRRTALNLRTARQARALQALVKMTLPEADKILSGWTPPGMLLVPAGPFLMGSTEYGDEGPIHEVWLDAFWIDRFPVTNAQYAAFVASGAARQRELWTEAGWKAHQGKVNLDEKDKSDHPVVNVTWHQALACARWMGKSLLSEAQWEKAASWEGEDLTGFLKPVRSGKKRRYPWGDEFDKDRCNTSESGIQTTTPVGKYSPQGDSPYGCADMAGNVWEWVSSLYRPYPVSAADNRDDLEASGARVLRGGSWNPNEIDARCAYRYPDYPALRYDYYGFRAGVFPARA